MFFRNLTLFRFPVALRGELSDLDAALAAHRLRAVGPLELSTRGFVSPFGGEEDVLSHRVDDGVWLSLGGEDKILPAAVVNDLLARRAAEIEAREGRKLGGRARKRLKEELVHELLPRAFVRPSRTGCHLDLKLGLVAVDTSSRKTAEGVLSELRQALGSFPAVPVNAEVSPRSVLTGWLAGEPLPEGLVLGDECELRDPVDRGAVVKAQRQELDAAEIRKHLEAGKQCSRLALVLDEHLSFVLGEDLVVRKLKFLDGAVEVLESSEPESQRAELDARYALMVGELRRLFGVLERALRLSRLD
ncbi:MAG: recombination-associated protein RdgC [Lysobacteraceae bacterium]|nr:MAG: recombination-associated protein RdgC [Xanthomonadaceae bacterium]